MPLDARIPLQAIGIQAPDVLGAMAQGQQYRQNQMAMQAAQTAAQRNAMIQQRAAATDFTSPDAVNAFVREAGPDATPYLEAAAAGAGLGTARSAEARAQGEYTRKIRGEDQGFMQRALAAVYNDPSDASIAAARAGAIAAGIEEADFDAYAARFMATPDLAARRALLANDLGTTAEGRALLERFTREIAMDDVGGSLIPRDINLLAPGAVMPTARTKTADPTRPIIVNTAGGIGSVIPGQPGYTPILDDNNNPVMPFDSTPNAPAGAADPAKTMAAEGLRSTMESMLGYYENLEAAKAIVSTERGAGENILSSLGASLPGRVLGRTIGSPEQTERDNIQAAVPVIVASLKDLTGMSAQQMNSNVELQLFLRTLSAPDQSIQTVREAFARFGRYVDQVSAAAQGGGGGGNAALEAEARRRGLIP